MKRILIFLLSTMTVLSAQACRRHHQPADSSSVLVGFVTDTTQALLPDAVITCNGLRLTTSWDGRFLLQPGQWRQRDRLTVSCEGYKSQKISLADVDASRPLVICLQSDGRPSKPIPERRERVYRTLRAGVMTKCYAAETADEAAVATMDAVAVGRPMSVNNTAVDAGQLTAGEVNDFAKWNLWPNLLDSTHRRYLSQWGITARERYTVQLTDKHGYPLVNRPVSLSDTRGNTVFQAVTDNTGKAELWNGLTGQPANVVQDKWQTVVLDEPCEASECVDVLFVFDATGSMGDELRYLQAEMRDVIARAKAATGGLAIRTGAVVYRDHGDDYLTRISRLTDDIATTQAFIDRQEADGGGDFPEAVPEALMAALNSAGWDTEARTRIAFLILDAPCHSDSATIALLHEQILNAAAMGVRIVPVVCSGLDESGELLMRSIALATNGTSFFLTDDSGIGHSHLKPTTDSLVVEHLNDMLVRTIVEFSYVPVCTGHWVHEQIEQVDEQFIPNPFDAADLEQDESLPHGPTTLYLMDISGKLICIYRGVLSEAGDSQLSALHIPLSTGIYFVKAFYDGRWHTRKILVH